MRTSLQIAHPIFLLTYGISSCKFISYKFWFYLLNRFHLHHWANLENRIRPCVYLPDSSVSIASVPIEQVIYRYNHTAWPFYNFSGNKGRIKLAPLIFPIHFHNIFVSLTRNSLLSNDRSKWKSANLAEWKCSFSVIFNKRRIAYHKIIPFGPKRSKDELEKINRFYSLLENEIGDREHLV